MAVLSDRQTGVARRKTLFFMFLVLVFVGVYIFCPIEQWLDLQFILETAQTRPQGVSTAIGFLILFFVGGAIFVPIPIMAFALSLVFPLEISVPLALCGFVFASLSGYWLGRNIELGVLGKRVQTHLHFIEKRIENRGGWAVMTLRMAPTPPFTITSVISGSLKVKPLQYIAGSTIGIAPLGLSVVFFGQSAIEFIKQPSSIAVLTLLAAIVLFLLYRIAVVKAT